MLNQPYSLMESQILWQPREGMRVYDVENEYVGRVRYVQFPTDMAEEAVALAERQLIHIPEELRGKLVRDGFVQVGGGLFSPDYYILPGQISTVTDDGIALNIAKDEIVRY